MLYIVNILCYNIVKKGDVIMVCIKLYDYEIEYLKKECSSKWLLTMLAQGKKNIYDKTFTHISLYAGDQRKLIKMLKTKQEQANTILNDNSILLSDKLDVQQDLYTIHDLLNLIERCN